MAVKLRLKRFGRTHRAYYRLTAVDGRAPRNGKVLEELGHYDPEAKNDADAVRLNRERIEYWLGVGAQPSETVAKLIGKAGISVVKVRKAGASAQAK